MWWRRFALAFSLAVNAVLVYGLVWSDRGLMTYQSLKEQHKALEARIQELDEENLVLSQEIRRLQSDDAYLEKVIRQRFSSLYVKDNEILYIFPDLPQDTARTGAGADETEN
jgi:cell division protein FtsB